MVVALIHCHGHFVQRVICVKQNGWMFKDNCGSCDCLVVQGPSRGRSRLMNVAMVDWYDGDVVMW